MPHPSSSLRWHLLLTRPLLLFVWATLWLAAAPPRTPASPLPDLGFILAFRLCYSPIFSGILALTVPEPPLCPTPAPAQSLVLLGVAAGLVRTVEVLGLVLPFPGHLVMMAALQLVWQQLHTLCVILCV